LGAVLYEMVALARPFEAEGDLMRLLEDVSKGRFEAPTARSRAPWEIPAEIEAVVQKAMARRPEKRYASAALLRADVEAYRDGRTLGAVEYSPWQVLAKWVRRHRTAAIGATATILAALLGIAAVVVVARHTRLEEEARVRSERIAAAEKRFEAAASRGDSSAVQFNPAVPQEWFLALLPVVEEMGRAIEEHPEPPQAWRRRLDEEMDRLQAGAEEVGDWALAEHLAQTADGWGVIPAAEREKRLARPAQVRLERARADVSRLEGILEMVSRADKDKRFGLLPGELEERAREIVRLPSRARVAQELLTRVAADNLRRERDLVWGAAAAGAEGGMSLEQRILAAEVLGRLKNVREIEGGLDAPGLVARTIRSALGLLLPADEVAAWIRAAGRLEAAEPECFPPPGVRELLDQAEAEYSGAAPVAIAAERVRLFWKTCLDRETLPADLSVERREALIEDLGDWAAARVSSGTDYTGYLVGRLEGSELAEPEERVLLDQIGLHGDASGPPGRSPVSPLRAAILDPPAAHLRDETSSGEGASLARRERRRAVRAATNLARLQVPETVLWLWSRLPEAGSRFGIDVGLALRLVPPERWPAGASVEEELHRAAALRLAGWPSEARIAASGIIERDPRSAEAYTIRSLARLEWGDIEGALADAQEALRLDPDHVEALAARAAARFESGDLDGGMSDYARVIALAPRVPEYLNDRATERGARGDVAGAVSDLERAAELAPESYLIQSNLADALQQAGELERALAAANRAIELDPSRGEGFVNRANILRRLGRLASALEDASAAALLSPGSWQAFAIRAVCRSDMGDVSGSLEDFDRALALESDDPSLLVDRGQSRKLLGREEEALDDFSRAIEIAPEHAPAWRRRAELRASRGDRTGAIEDWSRAIEADPTAESWTGRGLLRMKTGDVSGAIADLDEALQIDPGHVVALYSRGKAHLSRGDLARAKEDLARAAELDPQTWPALVELGEILAREGDTRGADRAFAQALERAHPAMHPEILDARRGALGR
ncbi:MAG: tetratricopeptide repeat protein, partial [Planctomycetes bacterium]|nr:tetratricopeptide repeat protein [Planctomycetota bacterium]